MTAAVLVTATIKILIKAASQTVKQRRWYFVSILKVFRCAVLPLLGFCGVSAAKARLSIAQVQPINHLATPDL